MFKGLKYILILITFISWDWIMYRKSTQLLKNEILFVFMRMFNLNNDEIILIENKTFPNLHTDFILKTP